MRDDTPFIRSVAFILVLVVLRASVCPAASMAPGSLVILESTFTDHEARAAWEKASREVYLDPLMLVLNEDEVSSILRDWRVAGEAVDAAWRTADRAVLERTQVLLDEAWEAYYAFAFGRALELIQLTEELLESPGDSRFRSRLAFESLILEGMTHRAMGDRRYMEDFKKAAAVSPSSELSPERYSPEILSAYAMARDELLKGQAVLLAIHTIPADAEIMVDGKAAKLGEDGARPQVFPGRHFIEARASGYEPFSIILEVGEWDSPSLRINLVQSGPDGEADEFFLERLKAGDRFYLSQFLERLEVDYVLIPDGEAGSLQPWLVGKDGRAAAHRTIWRSGDDPESAARSLMAMLEPLRQEQEGFGQPAISQITLPAFSPPDTGASPEVGRAAVWKRYAPVLGLLILLAAGAGSGRGGGGGTVEVTW